MNDHFDDPGEAPGKGEPSHQAVSEGPARLARALRDSASARLLRSPLLLVFLVALLVRVLYLKEIAATPVWYWHLWNQSDMHTFLTGARRILAGDLLVRDPYHPFHAWHAAIAPAEQWQRWYAPHIFHQVPGYYYLLAFFLKAFGGSLTVVRLSQSLLGAVHAVLLGAIGQRIMGRTGGLLVGILAAIYGPMIVAEPMILREGVGLLFASLGLFMVLRCLDARPANWSARAQLAWLAAGVVLGIGALTKETGFVLFGGVWVWVVGHSLWRRDRHRRLAGLVLLAGFTLGLSPLILRNVAVGASPLAFSPQGAVNFILGNAADSWSGGVIFDVSPSLRTILEESQGRLLPSILATLRTYEGRPIQFFANMWAKFSAIWSNIELPDNFNYEYVKMHSVLLQSLPRFVCVWLPAALGLLLLTARALGRPTTSPSTGGSRFQGSFRSTIAFPGEILGLLLVVLVGHVLAQSFLPVMSRYRLVIVPYLMLSAGWALAQGLAWLAERRWRALGGLGLGMCALVALWLHWPTNPQLQSAARRTADFMVGASLLMRQDDAEGAREEFDRGLAYVRSRAASAEESRPKELDLRRYRVLLLAFSNRFDEVRDDWPLIKQAFPHDPAILRIQQELLQNEGRMAPGADVAPDVSGGK